MPMGGPDPVRSVQPSGTVYLACDRCGFALRFLIEFRGQRLCRRCVDELRWGRRQ